ncbi:alpha/beta fold hydrolase [Algoriphagus namhaensis]
MRLKTIFALFILLSGTTLFGQNFKIKPYDFLSNAGDTVKAEYATFKVLEDRTTNSKDSIELSFIRFKSTNPNPGFPIVYLSGGPGGSGTATAKGNRFELFMKLREVSDVIAFDQRATGFSEKLPFCPYKTNFELSRAIDKPEYILKTSQNIENCLEFWSKEDINLYAYNTTESAKDLDDLRTALDVDKISIWGISYGSHLAFEYIRLYEKNLDKVILASLEGPDETIKLPKDTENFLFQIAELAKDNYGSEIKYPNLKEEIIAVHDRLKKRPAMVSYQNSMGGRDTVYISNFELQSTIATFYLKNPEDSKNIPKIYRQMFLGDFSGIVRNVILTKRFVYNRIEPMPFAMDMLSGISDERKKLIEDQLDETILGSSINLLLFEWMSSLKLPPLSKEFRELSTNNVNALLLSGSMDGRTYLNSAIEIAKKFKKGHHIIIENAGHDLFMASPEIGEVVLKFFKSEEINLERMVLKPTKFN